jgi:hypothetical protein
MSQEGTPELRNATNTVHLLSVEEKHDKYGEEFSDFYSALETYNSTVPEAVIKYYLQRSGLTVCDQRILCVLLIINFDLPIYKQFENIGK